MAIKITSTPPAMSAHEEAAASIETEITTIATQKGEPVETHDVTSEPLYGIPPNPEIIGVTMGFKMPVAPYTMLEFRITRSRPVDPSLDEDADSVFGGLKTWVEDKLNSLIEEQQSPQDDG